MYFQLPLFSITRDIYFDKNTNMNTCSHTAVLSTDSADGQLFISNIDLSRMIRAGEELTWDYGYKVGSVAGREMFCRCGAPKCRGRLL